MRTGSPCPKCRGTNIIRVPGRASVANQNSVAVGRGNLKSVLVTRYVCRNCGFSEEWIDSADDLRKLGDKYGQ